MVNNREKDSSQRAYAEVDELKGVKYLPDNQRQAVLRLVRDLIDIGDRFPEPRQMIREKNVPNLRCALMDLKEAIREGVPREILLVVLDRSFLEPIPAEPPTMGMKSGG